MAAAQTNDELAALESLQELVPESVSAWPELNGNRLNEWLARADAIPSIMCQKEITACPHHESFYS
jgi:hypothetical protein